MVKKHICAGAIIFRGKKMLLLEDSKLKAWSHLSGHVGSNEMPDEAVIREAKTQAGLDIRLLDSRKSGPLKGLVGTIPAPFTIAYEKVRYPDYVHLHYTIIYLAAPKNPKKEPKMNKSSTGIGWFGEEDLDNVKTFLFYKKVYKAAFAEIKKRGTTDKVRPF